ncbi:MAG: biopolymer transporter ExbD [Verrucomicrobiaceae bacterium]|nr:biopolymer transporter ExbD [Verrucomicrobiaceae bacterium]
MKLESNLPRQSPWIFAAPFMTAIMLLIICFLFSSDIIGRSGINIDLPVSTSRLTGFDRAHIITIPAGADATLYFDGQPVDLAGLAETLKQHRDGERRAIIHHDRMAPGGRLVEVTNIAHAQGYSVALATVSPQQ